MSIAHEPAALVDVLSEYLRRKFARIRSPKTHRHYERAVEWLGQMLGRPALLSDLDDDTIIDLLRWCTDVRGQCPVTANTTRKCLVALWRWCHLRGLTPTGPTVDKLPEPRRQPKALTRNQLAALIRAAKESPGVICGMPASTWWLCLFALDWDTGARAGELLAMRWEWLVIDGDQWRIDVPPEARKGGMVGASYRLTPLTIALLSPLRRESGPILGYATGRRPDAYYLWWDVLLLRAGLPADRYHKTQSLRRSFATQLAIGGGDVSAALTHSDPSLARRSYIDPGQAGKRHGDDLPFHVLELGESG